MLTAWNNADGSSFVYDGTFEAFIQNVQTGSTSISQTNNHKVFINNGHYLKLNASGYDKMYCGVQVA